MKANSPRIKFLRTITKCIKERKCCRPFAYAHHKLLLWRSRCRRCAVARTAQLRHLHCDYSNLVTLSSVGKLRLLKWNSQDMISEFRKRKNISSRLVYGRRIRRKKLRGRNYFFIRLSSNFAGSVQMWKIVWKSSIALGDIASWNVLMFLKLVAKWREIQKSKLNNSLINWAFQRNFFTLLFLSRLSRSFKIIYLFWHILKFIFCSQSCDVIFKPKNVKIEKQKT